MTVEQLMRLLSEYPPHWRVAAGGLNYEDKRAPVVEIAAWQDSGGRQAYADATPVVVIST